MSAPCVCGARKAASLHLTKSADFDHPYADPSRGGLKPVSDGRLEYAKQIGYSARSKDARSKPCGFFAAGAPEPTPMFGTCNGDAEGVHHTMPRSRAGGLEAAERYPKVPACNAHNAAATQDPEMMRWAETHTFRDEESGRDVPFLLSMKGVEASR